MSVSISQPEKTNLYINSINSQDKNKINVLIPDGVLTCNPNEDFYITIISFNTLYTFYQVIDGYNNQFNLIVNGVVYNGTIPYGNINVNTIINYFNTNFNYYITITYDKIKNKFTFVPKANLNCSLQLINCHSLLGFNKTETIVNLPATSSIPINVMSITNLFLHLEPGFDLSINDGNLDNHTKTGEIQVNNIVCSIPVKEIYNGLIVYENYDGGTSFSFKADKQETIQNLSISVKDHMGNYIPNIPDFNCIIQFSKQYSKDPYLILLEKIRDYLFKLLFLISSNFIS